MNGERETMTRESLAHFGKLTRLARFAVPGIVFTVAFGFAACTGKKDPALHNCPTDTTSVGSGGAGGATATGGPAGSPHSSPPPTASTGSRVTNPLWLR